MTDYEVDSQERTATDHPVFGYDQAGRAHGYDAVRATVVVTADGEVVHTEQLAKAAVPEWIAFIEDDKCGWAGDGPWWTVENLGSAEGLRQRALDELALRTAAMPREASA